MGRSIIETDGEIGIGFLLSKKFGNSVGGFTDGEISTNISLLTGDIEEEDDVREW